MNRTPRTWALLLLASTAGALVALTFGGAAVFAVSANPVSGCGCATPVAGSISPWRGVGLVVAVVSGLLLLLSAISAQRAAHRGSLGLRQARIARRKIAGARVSVVRGSEPHAYCTGGWRPEIAVTDAFLTLATSEQAAVIAHEMDHRRFRDPLTLAFLRTLGRAFPLLKPVAMEFHRSVEFAADDAARLSVGDEAFGAALATAVDTAPASAVGFSPTEARIRRFLGEQHRVSRAPLAATAVGFAFVLTLLVGATVSGHHAVAREGPAICRAERIQCERVRYSPVPLVCITTSDGTECLVP